MRPPAEQLVYEVAPTSARVGALEIIDEIRASMANGTAVIQNLVCYSLRVKKWSSSYPAWEQVERLVHKCEWNRFYDLCEKVYEHLMDPKNDSDTSAEDFESRLNEVMSDEGVGYHMVDGRVERRGEHFIDQRIHEVRQLLREPRFEGPSMHFEKAVDLLNERPSADTRNCVKEAASALEAVGKILSGDHKKSFGAIYAKHFKDQIPSPLNMMFDSLWGYASTQPGIRHGSTTGSTVAVEEAELCLAQAASMMLYLVRKFGHAEDPF